MRLIILAATFTLALGSAAAVAHDEAKGPNGGPVIEDAGHHIEFVNKPDQIALYLLDETNKPLASAQATGKVVTLSGATQTILELVAAEPNLMIAKLGAPLAPDTKLVISIKLTDGHTLKARFVAP